MKKNLILFLIFAIVISCNQNIEKSEFIKKNKFEYTIQFNAGEGSGEIKNVKVTSGSKYTLPNCKFIAPIGKKFGYWQTSFDGETHNYASNDKFVYTASSRGSIIVFTVIWLDKDKHLITFHNYDPVTRQSNFFEFTENETVILPDLKEQYYNFRGWFDSQDGKEQIFGWRPGEKTADVELWGKWTAQKFKIIYHNVEDVSNDNPTTFTIEDDVVLNDLQKDGYKFYGWYNACNNGNKVTGWNAGEKICDVTLWARWVNNYIEDESGDIVINGVRLLKTSMVTVLSITTDIVCDQEKGVFVAARGSVTIPPYAIGKYPVTQGLFNAVMGTNPSNFTASKQALDSKDGLTETDTLLRPVESVNWYQAIVFCNKLSFIAWQNSMLLRKWYN